VTVSYRGSDLGDAEIKVKGGNTGQGVSGFVLCKIHWNFLALKLAFRAHTDSTTS
jgi:hypothetical protein